MKVRGPPNSMILILLSIWFSILFEAMTHLTKDLELADENWDKFINEKQTGVSPVLEMVEDVGYAVCLAIYFFRIWMFWWKSGLKMAVQSFGDAAKAKEKKPLSIYLRERKFLGNETYVGFFCFLWVIIEMTPVLIINVIINSGSNSVPMIRVILSAVFTVPVFIVIIVLTMNVTNKFGIVREYMVLLLVYISSLGMNFLLYATPWADTYYRLLIGFVFRAFAALGNYIWLMLYVRTFQIENLSLESLYEKR